MIQCGGKICLLDKIQFAKIRSSNGCSSITNIQAPVCESRCASTYFSEKAVAQMPSKGKITLTSRHPVSRILINKFQTEQCNV
jgi:hypothetical protein